MSTFQVMPDLTPDEYEALKADIKKRGIQYPILIDEDGNILDGHHRSRIADELGIDCPHELRGGLSDLEKMNLAVEINVNRRHLTREQRRELVENCIKAAPEKSDRQIAKATGASPTTVGTVRAAAEADGDVSKLDTRTDSHGRQQPANKPRATPMPTEGQAPEAKTERAAVAEEAKSLKAAEPNGDASKLNTRTGRKGRQKTATKPTPASITSLAERSPQLDPQVEPPPSPVNSEHEAKLLKQLKAKDGMVGIRLDDKASDVAEKLVRVARFIATKMSADERQKLLAKMTKALEVKP